MKTFGTLEPLFANRLLNELLEAACRGSPRIPFDSDEVSGAIAAVHGLAPRNEAEGMLVAQMVATHSAAMTLLRRLKGTETIAQQDSAVRAATKLLGVYAMQMDVLQRAQGKGWHRVSVEHVHVHSGAQAIVGPVNACRSGQPHSD
jgi:hypothetical protein